MGAVHDLAGLGARGRASLSHGPGDPGVGRRAAIVLPGREQDPGHDGEQRQGDNGHQGQRGKHRARNQLSDVHDQPPARRAL